MEVRTCRQCKRLFNYLSGPSICPGCKAEYHRIGSADGFGKKDFPFRKNRVLAWTVRVVVR